MLHRFFARLKQLYDTIYAFITEQWIDTHEEGKAHWGHSFAHFWLLVFKSFTRNRCPSRATALAYTTLLALVPSLAVVASITTGLLQDKGEERTQQLVGQLVDAVVPQLKLVPQDLNAAPEPFKAEDITDLDALAKRLSSGVGEVARVVWNRLSPATRQTLTNYVTRRENFVNAETALVQDFNTIVQGELIYDPGVFRSVELSSATRKLLEGKPSGNHVARLNRMLLEDAFSQELARTHTALNARQQVVENLQNFISNIHTKTLGASGIIALILVAIMLLATIEDTFNDIWGVTRGRNWFRRLVQYWTTISLGPIALVAGLALLLSSSYLKSTQEILATWTWLHTITLQIVLPFLLVSIAFALLYKLMPNTQVHWAAAMIGGLVGGSLWLFVNIFNGIFLSRVVTMTSIYGPLSTIPIFLVGLYFSWLIVLFGAQVAYAHQNRLVYVQEKKAESVSQRGREYVSLRVMTYIAQRFQSAAAPPTLLELATELGVPSRLVGRVLQPLVDAHLVLEVSTQTETGYSPGRPIETITCHDILQTLRSGGGQELLTRDDPSRAIVCAEFDHILATEREAAAAVSLKDMVDRVPVQGRPAPLPEWKEALMERRVK